MKKTVILVLVSNRTETATEVQKHLTKHGCYIKTRLGLHEGVENKCSESGLIILEVIGEDEQKKKMHNELNNIDGVHAEIVELEV